MSLVIALTAATANAEGIKTKIESEKGVVRLKFRADTHLLLPGDGAYRVDVHFHTDELQPHPCLLVAMKVDPLNPTMALLPDPNTGILEASLKLTDDNELKVKIVQGNAPASQTVVFHLFSTDLTGAPIALFGTQWQLGQMTQLPPPPPGELPGPGPGQDPEPCF